MLGWTTVGLFFLALVMFTLGALDMSRASGGDKMGGAWVILLAIFPGGLSVVLGIVWLALHVQFR